MRQSLKKGTVWEWTKERIIDFENLKKELPTQPCLAHYNGYKDNIVTSDACNTGIRIALWQRQNNSELEPIAFASQYLYLNDGDKTYSVGKLEFLAVVWGLEPFRFIRKICTTILRPSSFGTFIEETKNKQTIHRPTNTVVRQAKRLRHYTKSHCRWSN